ncbi:MarR family transcriptional regulator [Rapidithrix thailandica]|uniref:MarR family transcriptional regulator n=2 Tax=Rapidithrix thailandica TaxID=413964 RepID=A0AAW9S7X2_9BACT
MTAGELAILTGLTTGAITGVIDRLEKRGFVNREKDPKDRRKVLIVPDQEKSFQVFGPMFTRLQEKLTEVYQQFSEDDLQIIASYFDKTNKAIHELAKELKNQP